MILTKITITIMGKHWLEESDDTFIHSLREY